METRLHAWQRSTDNRSASGYSKSTAVVALGEGEEEEEEEGQEEEGRTLAVAAVLLGLRRRGVDTLPSEVPL